MKNLTIIIAAIIFLAVPVFAQHQEHQHGEQSSDSSSKMSASDHSDHRQENEQKGGETIWTCSMHPQIRLPKPGKCPICHMDLIPVESDGSDEVAEGGATLKINERAAELMGLVTSTVERKWVDRLVRLVGTIDYDETQVKHITAWVPGRIDRMFVDYSGIQVRENDHMVSLYSPDLVSAQEELIQSARALGRMGSGSELVKNSTRRALSAAREKLRLLGLTSSQVAEIEKRGNSEDRVTIYAPMGGTVVEKHVNEGMYVQTGSRIYTIANLDHLWLNLDAYESDLPWITYGQQVDFSAEALPGEMFNGVVSFVHPILNKQSRTVKVRVNVDNSSKRLKPGMFVTANARARIDSNGEVLASSYADKFVCPMHPEVVEDFEGKCPICGMALVEAQSLPFVRKSTTETSKPPLVIPVSAPLITGTRAVVYVKHPERQEYEGREVILGPRAGNYYLVNSGLKAGEQVVTNGAFKIDADLQIRGRESMMNPGGGAAMSGHQH